MWEYTDKELIDAEDVDRLRRIDFVPSKEHCSGGRVCPRCHSDTWMATKEHVARILTSHGLVQSEYKVSLISAPLNWYWSSHHFFAAVQQVSGPCRLTAPTVGWIFSRETLSG